MLTFRCLKTRAAFAALPGLFLFLHQAQATSPAIDIPLQARDARAIVLEQHTNSSLARRDDLPTGTCNAATPCANGACCGSNNLCGYSAAFCGDGCQHNCDAKSECGPYAPEGSQQCPLSVCCSEFGYCGSTAEFCVWTNDADPLYASCDTAYGGCGSVDRPSCGKDGASVKGRTIGYYESWSNTRTCQAVAPEDLNLAGFTHINFAFAFFDPATFQMASMDTNAHSLYSRFTGLKSEAAGLQTWISVGGWSFTDPGEYQHAYSTMTSSQANRATFIDGLMKFMNTYGFDGVDLDWEYPGADDRGGVEADKANYVSLVKEMKEAFGGRYGISMTLPTSYWYLQHFDLAGIQPYVDWFNLMSYDLHGVWDAASKFVGPYIAPHTNITEIDMGMDLLWRAGVKADKVVLGQGWYGRSFTLQDPSCNTPNGVCQFSGAAKAGPCSSAAGILTNQEIDDIISKNELKPVWDHEAGVKWITWDTDQWVSYDDADTFQQKRDFANSRCLSGLMVWAMDQVDQKAANNLGQAAGVTLTQQQDAQQASADQQAKTTCRYGDCGASCPSGSTEVTESRGQPGQLSTTKDQCAAGSYRPLCCDGGTTMGTCVWRGWRGAGLSCMGGCDDGETEVTTNTNSHDKDTGHDQTCNGGLQTYCCKDFKPSTSKSSLLDDAEDAAKEAAEAAAEQAALDIAAKAFCRVAVPALLAPLEALEALIPIFGEIADIAEIAATPALIIACEKGIEKEGKAVFKVFGKEHSLSIDKPTAKPSTISERPPTTSHNPPKTSTKSDSCSRQARRDGELEARAACDKGTITRYTATDLHTPSVVKQCPVAASQACWHYYSAISRTPAWARQTCLETVVNRNFGGPVYATSKWSAEHLKQAEWVKWMARPRGGCERDEFPPAYFWEGAGAGQLIRYNPEAENNLGGKMWQKFCPETAAFSCRAGSEHDITPAGRGSITRECVKALTLSVLSIDFDDFLEDIPLAQEADKGLVANECYPRMPANPPANPEYFALLNADPTVNNLNAALWAGPVPASMRGGQNPPYRLRRRDGGGMHLDRDETGYDVDTALDLFVDAGNSSRPATPDERAAWEVDMSMAHQLLLDEEAARKGLEQVGYVNCLGDSCATQVTPINRPALATVEPAPTGPPVVEATTTTASAARASAAVVGTLGFNAAPSRPTTSQEMLELRS
ncbi:Killer toxin subunits alpha/beta [Cytospora mali]|uniref:chitinase n=1 Tax=Cytospora mali TaxID=578113 RepID=A0A194VUB9_CYTMA|nr:Killer toxin subunits alpha/beta [Valsa mali]